MATFLLHFIFIFFQQLVYKNIPLHYKRKSIVQFPILRV